MDNGSYKVKNKGGWLVRTCDIRHKDKLHNSNFLSESLAFADGYGIHKVTPSEKRQHHEQMSAKQAYNI